MRESPVLKQIMKAIGCIPSLRIWRNNTGMLWNGDEVIKINRPGAVSVTPGDIVIRQAYPVRFGLRGSADLLGIVAPNGRFFALEAKRPSGGKQSEEQINFESMITAMGGAYLIARSPEEALEKVNGIIRAENDGK